MRRFFVPRRPEHFVTDVIRTYRTLSSIFFHLGWLFERLIELSVVHFHPILSKLLDFYLWQYVTYAFVGYGAYSLAQSKFLFGRRFNYLVLVILIFDLLKPITY